jgi:hypothetical protein
VYTPSFNRTDLFKTAEEPKARVTIAENPDTSLEIARSRAENVPKAEATDVADTTDVAAADKAAEDTSAMAGAEPIKAPADALPDACLLELNADKAPEMEPPELLDGAVYLQATDPTASATTDRLGSGATTASSGPQAMERPLTVGRRKGTVAKTRKRMPILGL